MAGCIFEGFVIFSLRTEQDQVRKTACKLVYSHAIIIILSCPFTGMFQLSL